MDIAYMVRLLADVGDELVTMGDIGTAELTELNREFERDMCFGSLERREFWASMLGDNEEARLRARSIQ